MLWHAIDDLGDALTATRRLLFPFTLRRWLVLGLIVFFITGVSGLNPGVSVSIPDFSVVIDDPGQPTVPGWEDPAFDDPWADPIFDDQWEPEAWTATTAAGTGGVTAFALLFLLFGLMVALGIAVAYVASVMEFVLVEVARTRDVRVRGFFGRHTRTGVSLFLFRVAVLLVVLAPLVVVAVLTALTGGIFLLLLVILSPLLVVLAAGLWLLGLFTDEFVVPVMVAEDAGVIEGWRAFWPHLRAEAKQYGMFAVVRALLGIAGGTLAGLGFAVVAVVVAIPLLIVGVIGLIVLTGVIGSDLLAILWVVGLFAVFAVGVVVVGTVAIQVPIRTYLRYYSLFVLGSITPSYDLVDEMRAEIERAEATNADSTDGEPTGTDTDVAEEDLADVDAGDDGPTGAGDDGPTGAGDDGPTGAGEDDPRR